MPDSIFDVAIVGGGPAGAVSAAVAAQRGLRVLVLEREQFLREKVCGDCLNPACRPILERLGLGQEIAQFSQHPFEWVEFIGLTDDPFGLNCRRGLWVKLGSNAASSTRSC